MKIFLPEIKTSHDAKAHPFPLQIALQAQEFMQGAIFYSVLADTAAGQRIRQPKALVEIELALKAKGMSKQLWEEGWAYLEKYQDIFVKNIRQSALITIRSHWDWYISHLGRFIAKNYRFAYGQELSNTKYKELNLIGFKEITRQIEIIKVTTNLTFNIDSQTSELVKEMSLVRNLGLHNRWEVDEYYLTKSNLSGWALREIRIFDIEELENWHSALVNLINSTWVPIAKKYKDTPKYKI